LIDKKEIENMKKSGKSKQGNDQQFANNEIKRPATTNMYEIEIEENDLNVNVLTGNANQAIPNTFNKKLALNINNNQKTPK
jgi:hypothetical protein